MVTPRIKEEVLASLDEAMQDGFAYFDGEGKTKHNVVGTWDLQDMLSHLCYRHFGTAYGIVSAAAGGPPWPMPASNNDQINEITARMYRGRNYEEMVSELRHAHAKMLEAARQSPDWEITAVLWFDGRAMSVRQRLETLDRHMRSHLQQFKDGT